MSQKAPGLENIYISTWNYYLLEVNFNLRWINNLEHIPMDTMDESPVFFTMLTNIISSSPSPHMLVTFLLVPLHLQAQ